ncbi:Protein C44B7.7 [Aphelenchoides avenae]|nr:Protein C44B7.7 [Aphelenchus avenae]
MGSIDVGNVASDFFYYFAFGSNLLADRIHVQIKGAVFETVGVLDDHELTFFDMGARWRGAVASIEPQKGSLVWGCVWRVPNSFAEELDRQESGYHRLAVPIIVPLQNNRRITCRTYQYSNPLRTRQPPSPHYKTVIVSGAIEHKLPSEYIKWLKTIPDNGYRGRVSLDLAAIRHLNEEQPSDSSEDSNSSV